MYQRFVKDKLEKAQRASQESGNLYTASIFLALMSTLESDFTEKATLDKKRIGFVAYGSGSKAKVFEGVLHIGLYSKTASLRAILHYTADLGLYVTAQGGHTWRSTTVTDRDSYIFDSELIYSDKMPVPNLFDYSLRLGFIKPRFQTEFWFDSFTGLSGDDIRYNEAPQPTNKMVAAQIGWFGKGFINKRWGVLVTVSQILNGRNVGQSLTWTAGSTYFLDVNKKAAAAK